MGFTKSQPDWVNSILKRFKSISLLLESHMVINVNIVNIHEKENSNGKYVSLKYQNDLNYKWV